MDHADTAPLHTGAERRPLEEPPSGRWFAVTVALLAVLTAVAAIVSDGNFGIALAPLGGAAFLYLLVKIPLRYSAFALMFAGLTLENPPEIPAAGLWRSPLYPLGALLLAQIKYLIPVDALVMTGTDVLILFLTGIYVYRRATGASTDMEGAVPTARPLLLASFAHLAGVALMTAWGMLGGGEFRFALWQLQRVTYLPLMFFFVQAAFPGLQFRRALARLIVAAACIRAAMAIHVRFLFPDAPYGTTHADSMLFTTAACLLLIVFYEKQDRGSLRRCLAILPLLFWGMVANNRRLAWVELGETLALVILLTRWTRVKLRLLRGVLYSIPVVAIYCAAGWSSGSDLFKPVAVIRSVVDSKSDGSTLWRDMENFNLTATVGDHPIFGSGFGHPFRLAVPTEEVYPLELYAPHNSVLGLWAYTGYVGFCMLWMLLGVGVFLSIRTYRMATDPTDRATALTAFSAIVIYMLHCYGDMALGTWVSLYLVATALTMVGKLAVVVGAWPGALPAGYRQPATRST